MTSVGDIESPPITADSQLQDGIALARQDRREEARRRRDSERGFRIALGAIMAVGLAIRVTFVLVRQAHVAGVGIGLGIHRDGLDAHATGGLDDAAGDFAAVGYEDFREHFCHGFARMGADLRG